MEHTDIKRPPVSTILDEDECGCQVVRDRAHLEYWMIRCPMHAEAPNMLDALKMIERIAKTSADFKAPQIERTARAAIKAATN